MILDHLFQLVVRIMNEKPRSLIVDDEPQLTRVLRTSQVTRYDVRVAADGLSVSTLSVMATDLCDRFSRCRKDAWNFAAVRRHFTVPIIVLSAKGEEKTKVEALDLGADDSSRSHSY